MMRFLKASFLVAAFCAALLIGPAQAGTSDPIGRLIGANFAVTTDQAIPINSTPRYEITEILVTNCSASLTLAAGGFYSAASKGGTTLVAAAQVYSALTGSTLKLDVTLSGALTNIMSLPVVYLSLTTSQGSAATCDVYVYGNPVY